MTEEVRAIIVKATNLQKKDILGLSDPYVKVSKRLSGRTVDEYQTPVVKKTLNPIWEEKVEFLVPVTQTRNTSLLFQVYDENRVTRDDFLGEIEIMVPSIPLRSEAPVEPKAFLLRPRSVRSHVKGHIHLKVWRHSSVDANDSTDTTPVLDSSPEAMRQRNNEDGDSDGSEISFELVNMGDEVDEPDEPLPPGWYFDIDANGVMRYHNPTTRTTQLTRPVAGNNMLPPGWEERVDAQHRRFYVDHNNHITQWHRPTTTNTVSDAQNAERNRDAQDRFFQRHHTSSREDSDTDLASATSRVSLADEVASSPDNISATNSESLPEGWTMGHTEGGRPFYLNHITRTTTWEHPNKNRSSVTSLGALPPGWEHQIYQGRNFFIDHNTKTTSWEDPRLKALGGPAMPYSRDYDHKYTAFKNELAKLVPPSLPNKVDIKVKRSDLLETSFISIMAHKDPKILKTRLWVEFDGEKGLDYGGVSREWFYLLSKEMFNPYYGLFETSAVDNYTLQINALSGQANEHHLQYFRFIGRIAGMAVFHGKLLDGFFIRPFYKMMLNQPLTLEDMQSVEVEYYNSLKWILENDIDAAMLEMTFSVDEEAFGVQTQRELVPNGANKPVTDANKLEYVHLMVKHRFSDRVKPQMDAFKNGFSELIPLQKLRIFDAKELEYLICGIQDIDVNDWKANTNFKGQYDANHPTVGFFWQYVYLCNNEQRARILQFVTGTSRVPMNGFAELYGSSGPAKFTIENWGTIDKYPRSHTCFNRLDLPPYTTYQMLKTKLEHALDNSDGFDGVD